jgi:hypothetical protein
MFNAGYKANVVPSVATATVDGRVLPGREDDFVREVLEVIGPGIEAEWIALPPLQTTFDGELVDHIKAAIGAEDPGAKTLPYMLSAGTDAKAFARLGIRHFGFSPLKLPADLDFTASSTVSTNGSQWTRCDLVPVCSATCWRLAEKKHPAAVGKPPAGFACSAVIL